MIYLVGRQMVNHPLIPIEQKHIGLGQEEDR